MIKALNKIVVALFVAFLFLGTGTSASAASFASSGCGNNFKALVGCATNILNRVIPIIFVLAIIAILWGLALTLRNSDNEKERDKGYNIIIYGTLALTLMVCTWGVVNYVRNIIDLDNSEPRAPAMKLPSPPSSRLSI